MGSHANPINSSCKIALSSLQVTYTITSTALTKGWTPESEENSEKNDTNIFPHLLLPKSRDLNS